MDRYSEHASRPTLSTPERREVDEQAEPRVSNRRQPERTRFMPRGGDKKLPLIGAVLLLAVLAGLVWWFFLRTLGLPSYIDTSKYQSVVLQNGEFYFGKVTSVTNDTIQLSKVFYVQKSAQVDAELLDSRLG